MNHYRQRKRKPVRPIMSVVARMAVARALGFNAPVQRFVKVVRMAVVMVMCVVIGVRRVSIAVDVHDPMAMGMADVRGDGETVHRRVKRNGGDS